VIAGVEEKTETEWAASEPQSSKLRDAAEVDELSGTFFDLRGLHSQGITEAGGSSDSLAAHVFSAGSFP